MSNPYAPNPNPYAPAQSGPQAGFPQQAGGGYEFNPQEESVIRDLSGAMKFVAIFMIILGVLEILGGIFNAMKEVPKGISGIVGGVLYILFGVWTSSASGSFRLVVDTQGNDIPNMMNALSELKRVYNLTKWLIIIALVLGILAGVLLVAGAPH